MIASFDSQYWYRQNLVGLRIRTALSAAIYRKSLKLSSVSRRGYTGQNYIYHRDRIFTKWAAYFPAGEIVNLISVDCQKLQEASLFVNLLWSAPLQVALSIFFLYQQIGVAVFVGKILEPIYSTF